MSDKNTIFFSFVCILIQLLILQNVFANDCFDKDISLNKEMSIDQLHKLKDDAIVVLEGRLIRNEYSDYYLFSDDKGGLIVGIDDSVFLGRTMSSGQKIRIYGKYDATLHIVTVKHFDVI